MSGCVLIVGTWLAADKASFIDLSLNNFYPGNVSSIGNKDAEMILKVRCQFELFFQPF